MARRICSFYRTEMRKAFLLAASAVALGACGGGDDASAVPAADSARPAVEQADRATAAAPAAAEARRVSGDMLAYADVNGTLVRGYFAYPADMIEPLPGVLLIHDLFGLDDGMRAFADRIAAQGYIVLAADLFDGRTAARLVDSRDLLRHLVEQPDTVRENLRQGRAFLVEWAGTPRMAVIGLGSGGLWSLNTALMFPDELAAVVVIQGQTISDRTRLATLKMPLLGIFGAADPDIANETVRAFGETLVELKVANEVRLYPTAGRSFMLPASPSYSEKQAENAWELLSAFLGDNLAVAPR